MQVAVLLLASSVAGQQPPVVDIKGLGKIEGTVQVVDGRKVEQFLGVQYATQDRWKPPVEMEGWNGVKKAVEFGAACMGAGVGCGEESEDCLFLNIYRVGNGSAGPVPVMLFIHGGSYKIGCSNQYNGGTLAARGNGEVLVVVINYRLNVFGFLGSEQLRDPTGSTGNFGLQDQRQAISWVRAHIRSFGGDPGRVTVFGESAGAGSIACHLCATRSQGMFDAAIMESGFGSTWDANSLPFSESNFNETLMKTGCGDADCLRRLPAAALAVATYDIESPSVEHSPWAPVIDGVELTMQPWQYFKTGLTTSVRILAGTNRDEAALFTHGTNFTESKFNAQMKPWLKDPSNLPALRDVYSNKSMVYPPPALRGDHDWWWWATVRAHTDSDMTCPTRRSAKWLASSLAEMYLYFFVHPTQQHNFFPDLDDHVAVAHGSEVPFVFNCPMQEPSLSTNCTWDLPSEQQLSHDFSGFFINFAITGTPAGDWEKYDPARDNHYVLDVAVQYGGTGFHTIEHLRTQQCDFWDANLTP